jgi:hypothetical protein
MSTKKNSTNATHELRELAQLAEGSAVVAMDGFDKVRHLLRAISALAGTSSEIAGLAQVGILICGESENDADVCRERFCALH